MKCSLLFFSAQLLAAAALAQPPHVALLLSDDGRHADEFDGALCALGWTADRYTSQPESLRALAPRLRDYDMLITAPLFNARKDALLHGDDRQAYRRFLEEGGLIAVTDGSYPGVRAWLADIDPRLGGLESGACNSTQWAVNGVTSDAESPHPLRFFPSTIHEPNSWAHFLKLPKASPWRVVASCSEGFPVTLAQSVGKGLVSLSVLRQPSAKQLGNLYACLQLSRAGIALKAFDLPSPAVGSGCMRLAFAEGAVPDHCGFAYEIAPAKGPPQRFEGEVRGSIFELPYRLSLRGPVTARLLFKCGNRETVLFSRAAVLPPLMDVTPAFSCERLSTDRRRPDAGFEIRLSPDEEDLEGAKVSFTGVGPDGRSVATAQTDVPTRCGHLVLRLPLPQSLPAGDYAVRAILKNGVKTLSEADAHFKIVAPIPAQTIIDEDNTLLVGGKPFFPLGLYHVDPTNYADVAALGINTVQYWTWHDRRGLDLAAAHELKAIFELNHKSAPIARDAAAKFASHPALLMWYGLDEPAEGSYSMAGTLRDAYHASDGQHPVYSVSCRPDIFAEQAEFADVFAHDPYGKPQQVAEWMTRAVAAVQDRKPVFCVLGCFGQESVDEMRSAAYLALAHDARGILWYPWHQMGGGPLGVGLKNSPTQQAVIQQLCKEIAAFSPALTATVRHPFVACDGKLHGILLEGRAQRLLLLVNAAHEKMAAEVLLPGDAKGERTFRDFFRRRGDSLSVASGHFHIELAPYETRAYASE